MHRRSWKREAESTGDAQGCHNLPIQVTSFVGREEEIAEARRLLSITHLLTLVGSPGVGKTRLGLEIAARLVDGYRDGAWLVELAALADATLVARAVATTLGVREQPGRALLDTLADALRSRQMLLVLDNCEHLIEACAALVDGLLRACPGLRVLATSREPLGVAGEITWRVPSLSLPDARLIPPLEQLRRYEAVRLFIDRATFARPGFQLTEREGSLIAQICRRLDGIPLAIELAAARIGALTVDQISVRLDDRFALLTGGSRTALPRQQTLRGAIDWSYELLCEPERVLLRRLAVFAGGWTLETAEEVCTGPGLAREEILDRLARLEQQSLVVADHQGGEMRYRCLETIRAYGWERLREAGEEAALRDRHRDWCLVLAEAVEPKLHGSEQRDWLARLETEHDNLRAALAWSQAALERGEETAAGRPEACDADESAKADAALRLAGGLGWFWWLRGHSTEGRRWLEKALAAGAAGSTAPRATALKAHGLLAYGQGDFGRAEELLEEAQALARATGNRQLLADTLRQLSYLSIQSGDHAEAWARCEESLVIARALGDPWEIARSLYFMGTVVQQQGRNAQAERLIEESAALFRELGDSYSLAWSLFNLALVARDRGDHDRAAGLLEESASLAQHVENDDLRAWARYQLGFIAVIRGDGGRATMLLRESLHLFREVGDRRGVAWGLQGLALLAHAASEHARAARLFGAADALRERTGAAWWPAQLTRSEQALAAARADLGEDVVAAAWAEGRAMSPEEAIEEALNGVEQFPVASGDPGETAVSQASLLTGRERQVAELIARGCTNRQIAAALVISERTVHAHVRNILDKLGFGSRAQVAVLAAQEGWLGTSTRRGP